MTIRKYKIQIVHDGVGHFCCPHNPSTINIFSTRETRATTGTSTCCNTKAQSTTIDHLHYKSLNLLIKVRGILLSNTQIINMYLTSTVNYTFFILVLTIHIHIQLLETQIISAFSFSTKNINNSHVNSRNTKLYKSNNGNGSNDIDQSTATTSTKSFTFHHKVSLPESTYTQVLSTQSLSSIATKLRQSYDDHFNDPRQPNERRFVWDPWFVTTGDGIRRNSDDNDSSDDTTNIVNGEIEASKKQIQYSFKRIQASSFFTHNNENNDNNDNNNYYDLIDQLTTLGRSIGLTALTPPWMSLYTNDDLQNLHTDSAHGQMAFVVSLCRDKNGCDTDFSGGETMLLKSEILDYWKNFDGRVGLEVGNIFRYVCTCSVFMK